MKSGFINGELQIIDAIHKLDPLVYESAHLFCDYFFNELEGHGVSDFKQIRNRIDNQKANQIYAHFITGLAFSPVNESLLHDIFLAGMIKSSGESDMKGAKNLAKIRAQQVYSYVQSVRFDNKIVADVTSMVDFLAKVASIKAGFMISIPSSFSEWLGEPLSNLMFNKTKFDWNFKNENSAILEVNLMALFAMEDMRDNTFYDEEVYMKMAFIMVL